MRLVGALVIALTLTGCGLQGDTITNANELEARIESSLEEKIPPALREDRTINVICKFNSQCFFFVEIFN